MCNLFRSKLLKYVCGLVPLLSSLMFAQDCSSIAFTGLGDDTPGGSPIPQVLTDTRLTWQPSNCLAVSLQGYVDNVKTFDRAAAVSGGTTLSEVTGGRTGVLVELKLWGGNATPASIRWVRAVSISSTDCDNVELIGLGDDSDGTAPLPIIPLETPLSWKPPSCPAVSLQVYMQGKLIFESKNPVSGAETLGGALAGKQGSPIEVKLWTGDVSPASVRWLHTPPARFADGFETNREWVIFEEIVNNNSCYKAGIAAIERSTVGFCCRNSLKVHANAKRTPNTNHLIAAKKLSGPGRSGQWVYSVQAFIPQATGLAGEVGPELSMQSTKLAAAGDFRTSTAGVQYVVASGHWNIWRDGKWEPFLQQPLQSGTWYGITIEADFTANRYVRFTLTGGGLDQVIPLSDFRIAPEQKSFTEEAFWITLESENKFNCGATPPTEYYVYYDKVDVHPIAPAVDVLSFTPLTGTGTSGTFTATFTHGGGATQHYLGYMLFLPTPNVVQFTAEGSCLIEYNRIGNTLRLINDTANDWIPLAGRKIESNALSIENSRCRVDVATARIVIVGTTMAVTVRVDFKNTMSGVLATFLQAFDVHGAFTDMRQLGNWEVPGSSTRPGPYVTGLDPTVGAGMGGTFTYSAESKFTSPLSMVHLLISDRIVGGVSCHIVYFPTLNLLNLINDYGTALVSPNGIPPGTVGVLKNSRCSISTAGASRTGSNPITVQVPVTFSPEFGGKKRIYVNAFDEAGKLTHWVQKGTWCVQDVASLVSHLGTLSGEMIDFRDLPLSSAQIW